MFSHFTLGSNDLERSRAFYEPAIAALDFTLLEASVEHGYLMFAPADGRHPHLFVCQPIDELPATWGNGFHLAFRAASHDAVDRFHASAIRHGGRDEGPPELRPHYSADYYGAYVRDPDGNKLQAVCYDKGRTAAPTGDLVSHVTHGMTDLDRDSRFYAAVLGELGLVEIQRDEANQSVGYGLAGHELPVLYIQSAFDGRPPTWGNGTHTALKAPSKDAVDRFHASALEQGGRCEGKPGPRPQYSASYYAAYVRDIVGNKLQAVYRGEAD